VNTQTDTHMHNCIQTLTDWNGPRKGWCCRGRADAGTPASRRCWKQQQWCNANWLYIWPADQFFCPSSEQCSAAAAGRHHCSGEHSCLCMCVCVCASLQWWAFVSLYACVCVCVCVCICASMQWWALVFLYVCVCLHLCITAVVSIRVSVCVCVCVHLCIFKVAWGNFNIPSGKSAGFGVDFFIICRPPVSQRFRVGAVCKGKGGRANAHSKCGNFIIRDMLLISNNSVGKDCIHVPHIAVIPVYGVL